MNRVLHIQPDRVLVRVSRRVSEILRAAIQPASQEFRQATEIEFAAREQVVERCHGGPPEFSAKLDVVPVQLPRKIVEKLVVRIHAISRVGKTRRTKMREAAHFNRRQSVIPRICRTQKVERIQSQRSIRVPKNRRILREEPVAIAVPPESRFVHFLRRNRPHPADRNQLRPDRRHRVRVRKIVPSAHSQWKALFAVPEKVAPGNLIVWIDILIDLDQRAVQIVRRRPSHR